MFQIIGYIVFIAITGGAFFASIAAGVYVGTKENEIKTEDMNK